MTAWMLVAVALLSAWHYVWDGIIAPSLRAEYRFKLFALRDRLRELKYQERIDVDLFEFLEESINTTIRFLPSFSIASLAESRRMIEHDPELSRRIEERLNRVQQSSNPEIKSILLGIVDIGYRTLTANSGSWYAFLIPLAGAIIPIRFAQYWVERFVALTEKEIDNALPQLSGTLILSQ